MRVAKVLGVLSVVGCGGAPGDEDLSAEIAENVDSEQQGLAAGGGQIAWRGAAPNAVLTSAIPNRLIVPWKVDIGLTRVCTGGFLGIGQTCHHELRGLQVWSYEPSNPDNQFRTGDRLYQALLGQHIAEKWHTQQCPGGAVVSGYNIIARSNRVEKLGVVCKNVSTGQQTSHPMVGSSDLLFADLLRCGDFVGSFQVNTAGNGMGATCVLARPQGPVIGGGNGPIFE